MRNKLFSFILIVLLFSGIFIFLKQQNIESKLEKRTLSTVDDLSYRQLFDGSLFDKAEGVIKDQFYEREFLLNKYYEFKILLNKSFFSQLAQNEIQYLSENVIEIDGDYLINNILVYDEDLMKMSASKGYNANEVDLLYPDIKTYIYMPTRIEEIINIPSSSLTNSGPEYRRSYIANLNSNITLGTLSISSIEDHKEFFYKSDFHWNNKGAYQGYIDIINMIKKDFDIDSPREIVKEIKYDYSFHGNISSEIGMIGPSDTISDYILKDIGEYKRYVNGEEMYQSSIKEEYAKNGNNTMYSDYDLYFGSNDFERLFDFDQPDKPNVLVFCDSYFNVIQEWFSSHFNKTILIDLRGNQPFDIDEYIEKYDIDIILITQMYKNLYFNGNTYIPLYND